MSHSFDIRTLTLLRPVAKSRRFYLLVKVSETYWFKTAEQHMGNLNIIPFMETNEFEVPSDLMIYYSVALYEKLETGSTLLQKKLMFKRDIKKEQMTLKFDGDNVAVLNFKARVTNNAANSELGVLQRRIEKSTKELGEEKDASKLDLLSLGVQTYKFINRLDPLVFLNNYLREVFHWTNPLHTLFFGAWCTFFILHPCFAIMIIAGLIVWHKDTIFIKLQKFSRKSKDRLLPKDGSLKLLQGYMVWFIEFVDNTKEMVFGEDKTEFIVLLNSVISAAWVFMVLPFFIKFETMLVFGLWFGLLVGLDVTKVIAETLRSLHRRPLETIAEKIESSGFMRYPIIRKTIRFLEKKFPGMIELPVRKMFYVYEYQRWWMGVWGEPYKYESKWSDEYGKISVLPRKIPPLLYQWIGDWTILINLQETDEEGFMYSTDIMMRFHKSNKGILDVIRRRRWIRICKKSFQR